MYLIYILHAATWTKTHPPPQAESNPQSNVLSFLQAGFVSTLYTIQWLANSAVLAFLYHRRNGSKYLKTDCDSCA